MAWQWPLQPTIFCFPEEFQKSCLDKCFECDVDKILVHSLTGSCVQTCTASQLLMMNCMSWLWPILDKLIFKNTVPLFETDYSHGRLVEGVHARGNISCRKANLFAIKLAYKFKQLMRCWWNGIPVLRTARQRVRTEVQQEWCAADIDVISV